MLPGRKLTIESMLKVLRRRRWLFVGPLFLGVIGGLLYSRSRPSLYHSDAVVQVVPQRIPDTYVESTVTARVEDRLSSIAQQVLSRTQLEAVILEFDLYRIERQSKPMEDVFELMLERVAVVPMVDESRRSSRQNGADSFRISFDYYDPRVARDVVAKLAGFFIDRNASERGSQAEQTSAFLEAQLADARARLETQERKLKTFREKNAGRLPTQMQTNMQGIQTTQLALQATVESLARDRDRKQVLQRLYADASADPPASATAQDTPGPVRGAWPMLPASATPRQKLEAMRAALAQMKTRLSAKHPDVVRATRVIEELKREVAAGEAEPLSESGEDRMLTPEEIRRRDRLREMRAEIESLDRQIAFKEAEERRLRGDVAKYQALLEAVPATESEWVALTRDYDTLQASYRDLLSKSENSRMAANLEQRQIGEQFRILDPPRVPLKPDSPNRIRINVLGMLAGLGLGLLLVGVAEYRDSSMRSEADVLGAIDLPVLVLLPYITTEDDRRRLTRSRWITSAALVLVCVITTALFWFLQLWKFIV